MDYEARLEKIAIELMNCERLLGPYKAILRAHFPESASDARELGREIAKLYAEATHCPNCPDQGWFVGGSAEEPEQEQCEYCYTVETSFFNVKEKVRELLEARLAARGQEGTEPAIPERDNNRCAICGWPLEEKGCQRGDCAMRPFPTRYYDAKRAREEYAPHEIPDEAPPTSTEVLIANLRARAEQAESEAMALKEFAEDVIRWAEAYPIKIFHEPTPQEAREAFQKAGFSLDCFAAMVLRKFTKPWADKARAALREED